MVDFLAADHHIGHDNLVIKFKARPFSSVEEMEEHIIDKHNSVVGKNDTTYFLGDVCFKKNKLELLHRMNGRKILVQGNHDQFKASLYLEYFADIKAYPVLRNHYNAVLSHIPIYDLCIERWDLNIHGHLHDAKLDDKRYICVSMEQIDYTPKSFEEILKWIR